MRFFGRDVAYPYEAAVDELLAGDAGDRAMAINLRADQRVSPARAEVFDRLVARPVTAATLADGVVDYFETKVRVRKLPDYVYLALNEENLLAARPLGRYVVHKDYPLARVLDLTGLHRLYQWARNLRDGRFPQFRDYPVAASPDDPEVVAWLDDELLDRDGEAVGRFVAEALAVMNAYRRQYPYQPCWATGWTALREVLAAGPERWLEVLGVPKLGAPRWLIVLQYRVREAMPVVRPTQLDAGWRPYHFPSPPAAPWGHPMDLATEEPAAELLPEFIHKQIDHPIRHWLAAGSVCRRLERVRPAALSPQRRKHHQRLGRAYGEDHVVGWMPETS